MIALGARRVLGTVVAAAIIAGCSSGQPPARVDLGGSTLGHCPADPRCVSSGDRDSHYIPPLKLRVGPAKAWQALVEVVAALPRTTIVERRNNYLRAESRSLIFRCIDDLEFLFPGGREIAVRSAARGGYSDWGANRRRIEEIRRELAARGIVEPAVQR